MVCTERLPTLPVVHCTTRYFLEASTVAPASRSAARLSSRSNSYEHRSVVTEPTVTERSFDLLDGRWYAGQPYADWAWMREHAPAYWDATNEVWALTRYADVLAVEK